MTIIRTNLWDMAKVSLNRKSKYTPAVTSVEECTKEETGVGAAMAAGSQAEKGIWALLVLAAIRRVNRQISKPPHTEGACAQLKKFHLPRENTIAIENKIRTSPIRLVKAVRSPALKDLGL